MAISRLRLAHELRHRRIAISQPRIGCADTTGEWRDLCEMPDSGLCRRQLLSALRCQSPYEGEFQETSAVVTQAHARPRGKKEKSPSGRKEAFRSWRRRDLGRDRADRTCRRPLLVVQPIKPGWR